MQASHPNCEPMGDRLLTSTPCPARLPPQVLLLFLHLSQRELDGSLGGRHLQHLQAEQVLKRYRPRFDVISSASRLLARYL